MPGRERPRSRRCLPAMPRPCCRRVARNSPSRSPPPTRTRTTWPSTPTAWRTSRNSSQCRLRNLLRERRRPAGWPRQGVQRGPPGEDSRRRAPDGTRLSVIVVWSPAAKRFPGLAAVVNPVVHELALDVVWRLSATATQRSRSPFDDLPAEYLRLTRCRAGRVTALRSTDQCPRSRGRRS